MRAFFLVVILSGCGAGQAATEPEPIRVGAMPTHPPFSERAGQGYVGIDVDLIRGFGRSIGRPVAFMDITWPSLLSGLVERRYELAVGGIHVTSQREAAARFSRAYIEVGKNGIVRCSDVGRFVQLEDVDRLGVQVLTTRGGQNENFSNENFPQASVISVVNSHEGLSRIADGDGDIFFVNSLLAKEHVRRDPRFCIGLGGTAFGEFSIAVLMTEDSDFAASLDRWLEHRIADGTVAHFVQTHAGGATDLVRIPQTR